MELNWQWLLTMELFWFVLLTTYMIPFGVVLPLSWIAVAELIVGIALL